MIDLHSHLLPGVDDGAPDLHTALELARMAVSDGIDHMVLTPHIHPGRYENLLSNLTGHYSQFRAALAEADLSLRISLAGEVRLSAEVLPLLADEELPFLGRWEGKQVMLLELPHSHVPPGSDKLVSWLQARDILPMIAHPERNKGIMERLDRIKPFVEQGCLFQLTAMSVTGDFGEQAYIRAHEMLEQGWATVVASDAHNLAHRPPCLSAAYHKITATYGEALARQLFTSHPAKIVS